MKKASRNFFNRPALEVAEDLIGCFLVRRIGEKTERHMITETEAYIGPEDLANHGSKGLTPRTKVLFGPPGHFYVYFVYGMHWLLNIVTDKEGFPAGVLIRGIDGVNGPARVTKKLKVDGSFHGLPVDPKSDLWVEIPKDKKAFKLRIKKLTRVGVDFAGPVWAKKKFRFLVESKKA